MNLSIFYSIDFYVVSAFINFITSLVLGIFIYLDNRKEKLNQIFALFAFSVSVWSLGYIFWQISPTAEEALFWSRAFMAVAIFTTPLYLHFAYNFVKEYVHIKKNFFYIIYGIATFFFLINITPLTTQLFVSHVEPEMFFPFWPKPGFLYHFYLPLWILCPFYAAYLIIKTYRLTTSAALKRQLTFVMVAMFIALISGSTNYFLWYGIEIPPFTNIGVTLYVLILGYAVMKHNLFNIKAIVTDFLVIVQIFILLIKAVLTEGTSEKIINYSILGVSILIGIVLIKAIEKEVEGRKKIEELAKNLEEANKKLKSLDKLKSEFISLASHQLRSPLTVIKGYSSTLTDGVLGELTPKQKEIAGHIYTAATGLGNVVEDFLSVTKIEQGGMKYVFEKTDIKKIIEDLASDMRIPAEAKHLMFSSTITDGEDYTVNIDAVKIKQVFLNLIDNSIKYTKEGFVHIELSKNKKRKEIIFSVSDSGVGISKETKAKLFTKFARGEGGLLNSGGSGLGLYLAGEIVKAHNGKIVVTSDGIDKGSVFSVVLKDA